MKIGVCDWGIGGLGFYALLRAERPDLDVVYLGDQGVPGYGKLPRPILTARVGAVLARFRDLGVAQVVVACNAASTVLDEAQVEGVRATGMIRPTLDAFDPLPKRVERIAVIGGRRTILSGAYARPLRAAGYAVQNRIAQPLSGLIEAGEAGSEETGKALDTILRPLEGVDRLILACTHYIVLEEAIRARLPKAELVDPAMLAWGMVAPTLPPKADRRGTTAFLTTGDPVQMAQTAQAAFGVECAPDRIEIQVEGGRARRESLATG